MPNYTKTSIYKLCCKDATITDIYIGSTCNFARRKYKHKYDCNKETSKQYNQYKNQFIRDNGGWDNWDMIQIKEFSCDNKKEKETEERKHIEELKPSLNKSIPTRTKKEYYLTHKEKIIKQTREYQIKNKEKVKEKVKQYTLNNKEKNKEKNKQYRLNNKEKIKEYYLNNKEKNKEKKREYMKQYYLKKKQSSSDSQ